ncbi:MAG: signal peptidase I [Gammaproteobacteria bacterium]|nr:signal peptidase I [Gammaproteobacteria bacterium]
MFEIILFSLVALCAAIILACKYVVKAVPQEGGELSYLAEHSVEPWYLDYARSFFPVLLIVFLLRGFIAEPFRIPSGSMLPTLKVGDFILVNKYAYGVRLPILHNKVLDVEQPARGDIMVFRYPRDNQTHYIKRVIGLPGDIIEYRDKQLIINGEIMPRDPAGSYIPFSEKGRERESLRFTQTVRTGGPESAQVRFSILLDNFRRERPLQIRVPEGHYFMMGDNRDNSMDSRSWGFVPHQNIVGKAFFVWFHWNSHSGGGIDLSRIGAQVTAH